MNDLVTGGPATCFEDPSKSEKILGWRAENSLATEQKNLWDTGNKPTRNKQGSGFSAPFCFSFAYDENDRLPAGPAANAHRVRRIFHFPDPPGFVSAENDRLAEGLSGGAASFPRGEGGPAQAGSEEEWRHLSLWETPK